MIENLLNPVAFNIGNLEIRWYAIILVSGMLAGLLYMIIDGRRYKLNSDFSLECWLWCIVLAIIFARVFYVVAHPKTYFPIKSWDDFVQLFAIWNGGITILGGILGGILGAYIASIRYKRNFLMICDFLAPAVLIGQIIGRWGNYVNQEAYGLLITDPNLQWFPFGVYIDALQEWHCATFFYEMVLNAVGFVILYLFSRKVKRNGIIASAYICWYCMVRAIMESVRLDAVITSSGLRVTQLICIIFTIVTFILIMLLQFKVFDRFDKKGYLIKELSVAYGDVPLEERRKKSSGANSSGEKESSDLTVLSEAQSKAADKGNISEDKTGSELGSDNNKGDKHFESFKAENGDSKKVEDSGKHASDMGKVENTENKTAPKKSVTDTETKSNKRSGNNSVKSDVSKSSTNSNVGTFGQKAVAKAKNSENNSAVKSSKSENIDSSNNDTESAIAFKFGNLKAEEGGNVKKEKAGKTKKSEDKEV